MNKVNAPKIILALLLLSAFLSFTGSTLRAISQQAHPAAFPLHSLAAQFIGLEKVFTGLPRAGYYTDKNMDIPLAVAQFEQAQYVLAPTVLELNNTSLPLIIFDCTTPQISMNKIKELKLTPVSFSNSGIILAVNPKGLQL